VINHNVHQCRPAAHNQKNKTAKEGIRCNGASTIAAPTTAALTIAAPTTAAQTNLAKRTSALITSALMALAQNDIALVLIFNIERNETTGARRSRLIVVRKA
jgi:hypothetical protein